LQAKVEYLEHENASKDAPMEGSAAEKLGSPVKVEKNVMNV
jgi:hypothetical protein